jgi:RimJ/RimL family protein N-acetyltransferase
MYSTRDIDVSFEETPLEQIAEIVREVDRSRAFLHSKSEPGFSCYTFLDEFACDPDFHAFALRCENEIAGFVTLLPGASKDTQDIGPMYIRPAYQGQGLGGKQIQAAVRWAKARGIRHMHARTWGGNIRARRIFEKAGFVLEREVPNARVNGDSTVFYLLDAPALANEQSE